MTAKEIAKKFKLPIVGSTAWRLLIKDRPLTHKEYRLLVHASNLQHCPAHMAGSNKRMGIERTEFSNSRGVGAARDWYSAPMAGKHSKMSANLSRC